jgi:four helix bundle protein
VGIQRFEEILAWQSARRLVQEIYSVTRTDRLMGDRALRDQLQRAAVSTMSNIAEGFERQTSKDFLHFLAIARGSNAEVCSLLYVALDIGYVDEVVFQKLMASAKEVARLLTAFRRAIDHRTNGVREDPQIYVIAPHTESELDS